MLNVQKMTMLAFRLNDGRKKEQDKLSPLLRKHAITLVRTCCQPCLSYCAFSG